MKRIPPRGNSASFPSLLYNSNLRPFANGAPCCLASQFQRSQYVTGAPEMWGEQHYVGAESFWKVGVVRAPG